MCSQTLKVVFIPTSVIINISLGFLHTYLPFKKLKVHIYKDISQDIFHIVLELSAV